MTGHARTLNGTTENYSYDAGDKLLSVAIGGVTTKSFSYDARGNTTGITTSSGTQSFTYNAEDKPISITAPGLSQTHAFNGEGARTGKTVNGVGTTYHRESPEVDADLLSAGSSTFNPGISEKKSGLTHIQHFDYLGTLKGLTTPSQSVVNARQFDAFGNPTASANLIGSHVGFIGDEGYQDDAETGLQQVGHRLYDPSIGRFLTRDPEGDGLNWYAYCNNNPVNAIDPEGTEWFYDQRSGSLYYQDPTKPWNPEFVGYGFAGKKGEARNNPDMQDVSNEGTIPRGKYRIGGRRSKKSNGKALDNNPLTPDPKNKMFERDHFLIHGGKASGDPSAGCMILNKKLRDLMNKKKDNDLVVWTSKKGGCHHPSKPKGWKPKKKGRK